MQRDTPEPMFSNNNYHPKTTMVENCVFSVLGRGNWQCQVEGIVEGLQWSTSPWETVAVEDLDSEIITDLGSVASKSVKTFPGDPLLQRTLH